MSALLNLGDKITAGNRADATFFYKKRVADDSGTLLTEAETDANNRELLAQSLFDKASIVYTAGGVKASKAYSVKGTDFTVTRAGVKNVVNRAGVLTEIPANTPATEFAGGVLKGTLIEPARTNLLLRSEEFDDEYWTKTNLNTTGTPPWVNVAVAPDGTTTAEKLIADTTVGLHTVLRAISVVAGSAYTFSIYAKKSQYDFVFVRTGPSGAGLSTRTSIVNLTNGTIVSETVVGQTKVIDANNGWYRIAVTTAVTTGSGAPSFSVGALDNSAGTDFAGNDSDGIFIWGAQIEASSVATSYIKTVDTAITQPADVITATGVSGLANGQGTVLIAFTPLNLPATTYHRLFAVDNGTSSDNGYDIGYGDAGGALARTTFRIGGATSFDSTAGAVTIGQRQIVAFAFANNDFQVALNGTLQGASASGSTNIQHSRIIIGGRSDGTGNNAIEEVYYFPTRLTNAELETLTTP
jgi:hypothetical protein